MDVMRILKPLIQEKVKTLGFEFCRVYHFSEAFNDLEDDRERFLNWLSRGWQGEMSFLKKHQSTRFQGQGLLSDPQSFCVFAVPYWTGQHRRGHLKQQQDEVAFGRVARYARFPDYHRVLKKKLTVFGDWLVEKGLTNDFRVCVDSAPLLERGLARLSGLGFIGKNTLLIRPGVGSYLFLAVLVSNAVPEKLSDVKPLERFLSLASCGTCRRCLDACPTGALEEPYQLNATKCISYWTIEKRTPLLKKEVEQLKEQVFGCDICQEVCPYNHLTQDFVDIDAFQGLHVFPNSLESIVFMNQEQYENWFGGTALTRAKWFGLVRNALYVLWEQSPAKAFQIAKERQHALPFHPLVTTTCQWILDNSSA
jgi:epoxyqueuosine reductase